MRHTGIWILVAFAVALAGCSRAPETYARSCAVPSPGWGRSKHGVVHLATVMEIQIDAAGVARWWALGSSEVVSDAKIRQYMKWADTALPSPQLVLNPAPAAPCDRVVAVRAIMNKAQLCQEKPLLCSEGNDWEKWPIVGGP